ncbi:hypothetical protein [Bradyrhizobium cosmicum]|uniref:Uncharacterized protein n=1 Tax=Bradyrhizobium cosmicum TaxID=1404864 RepID=A0AAI8MES8_9BRAD|nr:hypothetical protein [Bradyrhizobium cosmicum]BAL77046.1 hypothetical protein S23_38510 [Bradyrhizobium cosmicum]
MGFIQSMHIRRSADRSLWSTIASIFFGLLLLVAPGTSASADVNSAIDKLLSGATDQIQKMVNLATNNCSGGSSGQNPVSYDAYKAAADTAIKTLTDLRVTLARGQTQQAGPQLDAVLGHLDRMIGIVHNNCSGGGGGVDVLNFGEILSTKQYLKGNLDAIKAVMTG